MSSSPTSVCSCKPPRASRLAATSALQTDSQKGRATIYAQLFPQLQAIVTNETDTIANLANLSASLMEAFGFHWIGFYRVVEAELVLGPFQGPVACTRIARGRGVCGAAWQRGATIVVPDVESFPGHIACSPSSRSEIVVPYFDRTGAVAGVLDIDSDKLDDFSSIDQFWLEKVAALLR